MEDRTMLESEVPAGFGGATSDATQVIGSPGAPPADFVYGDVTQQAIALTCAVCQTPNPPSERYCQDCGFMLGSSAGEVEALPDTGEMPRLTDAEGKEFVLSPGTNVVGRENAEIWLPDPTVSRRHAQVLVENGNVFVEDLGSTNGSAVAGQPARSGERVAAHDGDTLKFGSVLLTLSLPGGAPRSAPAASPAEVAAPAPAVDRGPAVAEMIIADGTRFPLYAGVNTLGRRSGNDVVLPDAFASGKHAEITCDIDGSATLVDVGSTNGTFIGGERLSHHTPVRLEEGQAVTMGKLELTYSSRQPLAGDALMGGPEEAPAIEEPAAEEIDAERPESL